MPSFLPSSTSNHLPNEDEAGADCDADADDDDNNIDNNEIDFFAPILEDETGADFYGNDMGDDDYLNITIPMDAWCYGD